MLEVCSRHQVHSGTVQTAVVVCRVSISEAAGRACNLHDSVSPSNTSDLMLLTFNIASFLYFTSGGRRHYVFGSLCVSFS